MERETDVYDLILRYSTSAYQYLVLPHFTTTGTPYFDTQSAGVLWGLRKPSREEFIKALLEGVREMKFNLELSGGSESGKIARGGRRAKSPAWLQIKADVYGLPVETLFEAASLGAAL